MIIKLLRQRLLKIYALKISLPKRQSSSISSPNSSKLSYQSNPSGDFHLVGQTIQERLDSISHSKPNEMVYKFSATQTSFTFLELKQRVDELAQSFMQLGLQKGDRVAILLPNLPETVLSLYALAQIGCISVLMNPAYNIDEIEYMLKMTKSKAAIILDNFKTVHQYDILSRICPELIKSAKGELKSKNLPDLTHVILAKNRLINDDKAKYPGTWSFQDDLVKFNGCSKSAPKLDFDDPVALLFTSGTTGFPKAAPLSHYALINGARNLTHFPETLSSERILCLPIPIFHLFGLMGGTISAVVNGTRTIYPFPVPDTMATMRAIAAERCTGLKGAPTILFDIVNHPDRAKYDLSSLESVLIGASVVPKDLILKVKRALNLKSATIGYACTESGCTGTQTRVSDAEKSETLAYETIGTGQPFVEIKVIDPVTKNMVERGVDGEICIRSYGTMKGYWEDPIKTAECIDENRWYHTGDIGCMNQEGYLIYKSRIKEMIIRGGVNIYPAEIERLLRTHPNVLDCYVFGIPDERLGEELAAWIKLKPDCEKTTREDEIKNFADQHIAAFKVPKFIRFVNSFPISATGKIQKFKMTQQMIDEFNLKKK